MRYTDTSQTVFDPREHEVWGAEGGSPAHQHRFTGKEPDPVSSSL